MRAGHEVEQQRWDGQMNDPEIRTSPPQVRLQPDRTSWMLTSLLLWLCTLPIVGLLILPWLGTRVSIVIAAGLLVASVTACYGICSWQVVGQKRGGMDE